MIKPPEDIQKLLAGPSLRARSMTLLVWAGDLVNKGDDLKFAKKYGLAKQAYDKAEVLLTALSKRKLSKQFKANNFDYFCGNLWMAQKSLERLKDKTPYFWTSDNFAKAIYYYRTALSPETNHLLHKPRHAELLTNLANGLKSAGRFVEAIEIWERALNFDSRNGITLGNIGIGLYEYANIIEDRGQRKLMWFKARTYLEEALSTDRHSVYVHAHNKFERVKNTIDLALKGYKEPESLDSYSVGETTDEQKYKKWCLENVLFINPLNDGYKNAIAAQDVLSFPSISVSIKEDKPWRQGLFDQLKQEFVSARFMYFEGINASSVHFSDKAVKLIDSMDSPDLSPEN